ncbi:MAG: hypothetical protein FD165_1591 [Gammaproteobacteria bacterium]|nr:MAG: hypothetical protein FD165_1591 [Gammaproteobacteria bacterium]TND05503.1 MAG: hypothetical protein FD120_1111 [Gammaproteobacteria bacterium]
MNFQRLWGRRGQLRRETDRVTLAGGRVAGHYVDRYEPSLWLPIIATLCLSSLDAFLTLELLQRGAIEANGMMDFLIQKDIALFVTTKFALTSLGLIFLVTHYTFHLWGGFRVLHLLYGVFSLYVLLIAYEILLILHI